MNSKDNKGEEKGKNYTKLKNFFERVDSFDTFFLVSILMGMIVPEAHMKGRGIG